jgi:iron-sulfur cluster repair protein YtfE (RIC family)
MIKITDAFLGEHAVFYAQFDAIERTLESDELPELKARIAALAIALESHAHLENELLFGRADAAPFRVMESEHEAIEQLLHEVPRARDLSQARGLVEEMIALARAHFRKEETVAFSMAEALLGKDQLLALGDEWARARGVVLG